MRMRGNHMFRDYPDVVTVEQLCEMLHIGRNTAYTLIRANKIHHIRIGKKIKIPKAMIIEFVLNNNQ